ncbi:hypothetical protein GCK72_026050 [Caenorhabditis remanei]|uniref:Uncharacterized protein n=1 Tax=Caenorhabditis remanei TaxID=31234 RepID=A0A6A5G4G3_CAERE|nr:hypothetical protein GCK72_026050 [Caenorhabditis remanei]KAF1749582.1 hypothetical protein GCK72_026050 [Caenorhabditis remanei]
MKIEGLNIAEGLVSSGLSKVAVDKGKKRFFGDKTAEKKNTLRIQEITGDLAKAEQFLPYFQKGGRAAGVVEFLFDGSRLRICIQKETVFISLFLGGIDCPKGARVVP